MSIDAILSGFHVLKALNSIHGLYYCAKSITNLQKYEKKTEKAAEYSQTVADELRKTRTTQASALVATIISLGASLYLSSTRLQPPRSPWPDLALNAANIALLYGARVYVNGFWKAKAKVPFVTGYNEAISSTQNIIAILDRSWRAWLGTLVWTGVVAVAIWLRL
ncbi:hypothetical protein BKA80DRAFT_261504 [Phyllosticta citrichinensis]